MKPKLDILDRLEEENGFVRLTLSSGEIVYGEPKCIVYDEDEEGWETIKNIMFEPYFATNPVFYKIEDITKYEAVEEEDIPPCE